MINKNNCDTELDYTYIALLSKKINVLIVGGKRSAYIKCRTFCEKAGRVTVVAKEFGEEFNEFKEKENVFLINESYEKRFIENNHLVIIALQHRDIEETIIRHCEESCRLYLTCADFKRGKFVMPFQRESKAINFAMNIKNASPMTTRYIGEKVLKELKQHDNYVEFISELRQKFKGKPEKQEVMKFLSSEDFYFFYELGKGDLIFSLFFGGNEFEI